MDRLIQCNCDFIIMLYTASIIERPRSAPRQLRYSIRTLTRARLSPNPVGFRVPSCAQKSLLFPPGGLMGWQDQAGNSGWGAGGGAQRRRHPSSGARHPPTASVCCGPRHICFWKLVGVGGDWEASRQMQWLYSHPHPTLGILIFSLKTVHVVGTPQHHGKSQSKDSSVQSHTHLAFGSPACVPPDLEL